MGGTGPGLQVPGQRRLLEGPGACRVIQPPLRLSKCFPGWLWRTDTESDKCHRGAHPPYLALNSSEMKLFQKWGTFPAQGQSNYVEGYVSVLPHLECWEAPLLIVSAIQHGNSLPHPVVDSTSLEVSKQRLDLPSVQDAVVTCTEQELGPPDFQGLLELKHSVIHTQTPV